MEPENQQDNFDLKISKLEIDLSPPTRGQRSMSSRCIMGFVDDSLEHQNSAVVAAFSAGQALLT